MYQERVRVEILQEMSQRFKQKIKGQDIQEVSKSLIQINQKVQLIIHITEIKLLQVL